MRLFRVFVPRSTVALIICDFLLISACFLLVAAVLEKDDFEIYLLYEGGLSAIAIGTLSAMFALYLQDMYTQIAAKKMVLAQNVAFMIGVIFITQAAAAYVYPDLVMPRRVAFLSCLMVMLAFPMWRIAYASVIYKGLGIERVLFLGAHGVAVDIARHLRDRPHIGLIVAGFLDDVHPRGEIIAGVPVLGSIADLKHIVQELRPNRIVVSLAERRQTMPVLDLLEIRFSGVRIEEAATLYESVFGRVSTHQIRPSQLVFSTELGPQPFRMRLQTIYSFVASLIGLIIAAPVLVLVAIAVLLTSRGPILFRQRRVGLHGRPFNVLKFRSMVVNAEATTGAVWAKRNDPRVTGIGGFLRRTRLDELPQLFNVLRGEMSLVGPRPERPEFVATLSEQIPFYRQRHYVKPGVTGWAQINYKYGETIEDTIVKLEYDLYYIKNLSPSLDAYIIFHTIKVMLFSQSGQ